MKKILLFALFLIGGMASAQVVSIPDTVFKNWLLSSTLQNGIAEDAGGNSIIIDVNSDNEIQESEALAVSGLYLNDEEMTDATGLEAFVNLRFLRCRNNYTLTILDLTPLINLEVFMCINYQNGTGLEFLSLAGLSNLEEVVVLGSNLDTIDLTALTAMQIFTLKDVPVTNLDFTDTINLGSIELSGTNLADVNLGNCPLLNEANFVDNPVLETINVKNGDNYFEFVIEDNPELSFMCVDEGEDYLLLEYFGNENIVPPLMSSDCDLVADISEFVINNSVKIYPNPSNGIVKIDAETEIKSIYLYDIHGRQLQVSNSNQTDVLLDVSGRASGIYFMKVVTEKGIKVEKLIRE